MRLRKARRLPPISSDNRTARIDSVAPNAGIIHIASHGQFDYRTPLQSRILLASTARQSGDLTVADIYSLRLNAQLVTLSACQTALGNLADGDEFVGLVRGFLFAGAQNVVATLWEISDETTVDLMTRFYKELESTHSIPQAMRQAQIAAMRSHPAAYSWAAFVPASFSQQL